MKVFHFDVTAIQGCKEIEDVWKVIGYNPPEHGVHYFNTFMTDTTYREIFNRLCENNGYEARVRGGEAGPAVLWTMQGPVSSGPRWEEFTKHTGDIIDSTLYVIEEADSIYETCPDAGYKSEYGC